VVARHHIRETTAWGTVAVGGVACCTVVGVAVARTSSAFVASQRACAIRQQVVVGNSIVRVLPQAFSYPKTLWIDNRGACPFRQC